MRTRAEIVTSVQGNLLEHEGARKKIFNYLNPERLTLSRHKNREEYAQWK